MCSDLPKQHFLKQGATYRLLASNPNPELQHDPLNWSSNLPPNRISLGPSPLADKICSRISDHKDAPCEYPAKVVLDEDLPCTGVECDWSDIRTVQLAAGIWYEYVRVPCVHRAFYIDGQAMRLPWEKWFCGDPSVAAASTACCELGNKNIFAGRIELYSGERVSYEESVDRCAEAGARLCPNPWKMDCWNPELGPCDNTGVYYWTTTRCDMSVKVNTDGSVAIMHEVPERTGILEMVASTTKMFFRVDWISSKEDVGALLTDYVNNCREMRCFIASDGVCQCEVFSVTETAAFDDASLGMASTEEILSTATIGAFPPTVNGEEVIPGVWKYPTSHLSSSTVFEIVDANGITHYRKNVRSVVSIGPYGDLSFRNPVHFISLSDPTVRDAVSC